MTMRIISVMLCLACSVVLFAPADAARDLQKDFDEMTSAEKTAAKAAAKAAVAEKKLKTLRICGDPGNMPLSNRGLEGFQNKMAEVLARAMGAEVTYFWRPYLERGITRQTFDNNDCDLLMDMPSTYGRVLTTVPIYRTAYVLVYRNDKGIEIKSLDDPKLRELRIGVFQTSALRNALARRGIVRNVSLHVLSHDGDLRPEKQPWRQVQKVIDGELDVAGVWGPFAGWLKTMKGARIEIRPVNLWEDTIPLEFELSIGVRKTDAILKYMLEYALEETKGEIEKILTSFGVPLVQCSRCIVAGTLPSHGAYTKLAEQVYAPKPEAATPDQVVTRSRLESWLSEGADLVQELSNAVLAGDGERIKFLVGKGADVNARDAQGYAPLHTAARNRRPELIGLLVDLKADVNARDGNDMTPLLHGAMRNHVPTVKAIIERGADIEAAGPQGFPPVALALEEAKFEVAKALMEAGANINTVAGTEQLTPLMVAASQVSAGEGSVFLPGSTRPIDIARGLIERGADVDAQSKSGVTALMIAAARNSAPMIGLLVQSGAKLEIKSAEGKTALDIAVQNGNDAAAKAIRLVAKKPAVQN